MTKPTLPFVEIMPIQSCNLSCRGCSNYSDLKHQGYLTWEQGREQILPWLERVDIPDIGIVGGEPLMNPELDQWILGIRKLLPNSQIRFNTNGLLLHKYPDLIRLFEQVGNAVFKITVHVTDPELEQHIEKIYSMYDWEPVTEFGVDRYKTKNNLRFHVKRPDVFYQAHRNDYANMMPHHSDPAEAFKICYQQTCPLLFDGRIYKCSSNGLLQQTLQRFNWPNQEQWKPYLNNGIGPDCTDQELNDFIGSFGKPQYMCGMCPTTADATSRLIHFDHVKRKKDVIKNTN